MQKNHKIIILVFIFLAVVLLAGGLITQSVQSELTDGSKEKQSRIVENNIPMDIINFAQSIKGTFISEKEYLNKTKDTVSQTITTKEDITCLSEGFSSCILSEFDKLAKTNFLSREDDCLVFKEDVFYSDDTPKRSSLCNHEEDSFSVHYVYVGNYYGNELIFVKDSEDPYYSIINPEKAAIALGLGMESMSIAPNKDYVLSINYPTVLPDRRNFHIKKIGERHSVYKMLPSRINVFVNWSHDSSKVYLKLSDTTNLQFYYVVLNLDNIF